MTVKIIRSNLAGLLLVVFTAAGSAEAVPLDHTFVLTLNHSSGVSMAIPPSITALEVTAPESLADGGPLYEGQTTQTSNPLFDQTAPPGSPGSVMGVSITFAGTKASAGAEGIIHRDIATRNVLITTNEGIYEMGAISPFAFGNDGPENLRGVGPIRWMAPEALRSETYSPSVSDARTGSWEIAAFSYFDVSYPIPEPATVMLLAGGMLWLLPRQRR